MHRARQLIQHLNRTTSSPVEAVSIEAIHSSSEMLSSSSSQPILTSLPRYILIHLANTYLTDVEVNRTARVASIVLRTLNCTVGNQASSSITSPDTATRRAGYRIKKCLPLSYILSQPHRQAVAAGRIIGLPASVFTSRNDHIGLNRLHEVPLSVKSITFHTSFLGAYSYTKDRSRALPMAIKWPDHLTELLDVAFSIPIDQVKLPQQLKRLTFAADAAKYSPDRSFTPIILGDGDRLPPLKPRVPLNEKFYEIDRLTGFQRTKFTNANSIQLKQDELTSLVSRVWPRSLTHLRFESNQSLAGVILPSTILSLEFTGKFSQPLNGFVFPLHLQQLTLIPAVYPHPLNDWSGLPQSCTSLYLSVSTLDEYWDDRDGDWWHMDLSQVTLPEQIQFLTLSFARRMTDIRPDSYQSTANQLRFPKRMRALKLEMFNQPLSDFVWNRDHSTSNVGSPDFVPLSLSLGSHFIGQLKASDLPPNLTSIQLSEASASSTPLPPLVEKIYFGARSVNSLAQFEFPPLTRFISLPNDRVGISLAGIPFPSSLTELHLPNIYAYSGSFIQDFLAPTGAANKLQRLHSITTSYDEYIPCYHQEDNMANTNTTSSHSISEAAYALSIEQMIMAAMAAMANIETDRLNQMQQHPRR